MYKLFLIFTFITAGHNPGSCKAELDLQKRFKIKIKCCFAIKVPYRNAEVGYTYVELQQTFHIDLC